LQDDARCGFACEQFFELADIAANARRGKNAGAISPIALEAVRRIDVLFEIERGINGVAAAERMRIRKEQSAPLLEALEAWLREQRGRLSRSASVAERSTICSSVGIGSPASSTMAGSA
jgi:transposase